MRIKSLEIVGLTVADIMGFLFISIAFLYTQTEPLMHTQEAAALQKTQQAQKHVAKLKQQVKVLEEKLSGKGTNNKQRASSESIYVRLFSDGLAVAAMDSGGEYKGDIEGLIQVLKSQAQKTKGREKLILSGEKDVGYGDIAHLAERIMQETGMSMTFGL